jgi:hypothetical protein
VDLLINYEWNPGSLPPPSYYELRLTIDDSGDARVEVQPDYGFNDPPVWNWSFTLSRGEVERLRHELADQRDVGEAGRSPAIGGPQETITLEEGGRAREITPAPGLGEALKAVVPRSIWDEIEDRRAAYATKDSE